MGKCCSSSTPLSGSYVASVQLGIQTLNPSKTLLPKAVQSVTVVFLDLSFTCYVCAAYGFKRVPSTCTVQLLHLQHAFKPTSYCILKFYFSVAFQPLNSQHNSALVFHPCFYSLEMETEIFPSQSVKKSLITKTESLWNIFLETHWNVV